MCVAEGNEKFIWEVDLGRIHCPILQTQSLDNSHEYSSLYKQKWGKYFCTGSVYQHLPHILIVQLHAKPPMCTQNQFCASKKCLGPINSFTIHTYHRYYSPTISLTFLVTSLVSSSFTLYTSPSTISLVNHRTPTDWSRC